MNLQTPIFSWNIKKIGSSEQGRAKVHWDNLAKPPGSLGHVETLGTQLSAIQECLPPRSDRCRVIVFAGNHGVAAEEQVSPYPQHVTAAMIDTFMAGRAAVAILAEQQDAFLEVVDCGVRGRNGQSEQAVSHHPGRQLVMTREASCQSHNIAREPAMSDDAVNFWLSVGALAADRAQSHDIVCLGEMGIGNTTAASALAAKLLEVDPQQVVGPGTGLSAEGVERKLTVIRRALDRKGCQRSSPKDCLKDLGGFEIAALVGCMLRLAEHRIPILIDGFICSTAALVASSMEPNLKDYLIPTTLSAEPGHRYVLDHLDLGKPIFQLEMRLGEASGAALAIPIVRSACRLMEHMATLESVVGDHKG